MEGSSKSFMETGVRSERSGDPESSGSPVSIIY